MKYKYIGTEEQLEEYGFEVNSQFWASKKTDYKDENECYIEVYISLGIGKTDKWYFKHGMISFNDPEHDNDYDIKDFIEDLIEAGLVEVEE